MVRSINVIEGCCADIVTELFATVVLIMGKPGRE